MKMDELLPMGPNAVCGINPGHDSQSGITDCNWFVVMGGSGQTEALTLAANRELPVVCIDQLSSFMGVRAVGEAAL